MVSKNHGKIVLRQLRSLFYRETLITGNLTTRWCC